MKACGLENKNLTLNKRISQRNISLKQSSRLKLNIKAFIIFILLIMAYTVKVKYSKYLVIFFFFVFLALVHNQQNLNSKMLGIFQRACCGSTIYQMSTFSIFSGAGVNHGTKTVSITNKKYAGAGCKTPHDHVGAVQTVFLEHKMLREGDSLQVTLLTNFSNANATFTAPSFYQPAFTF